MTEVPDEAWEGDDYVRRTVVMPDVLAERPAARAEQRGLSLSDLLAEYAEEGLRRETPELRERGSATQASTMASSRDSQSQSVRASWNGALNAERSIG